MVSPLFLKIEFPWISEYLQNATSIPTQKAHGGQRGGLLTGSSRHWIAFQASRTVIHSADITFQMLEDWRNVDLSSITKQTLYTMEDSRDEHRRLIIQCKVSPGAAVLLFLFLIDKYSSGIPTLPPSLGPILLLFLLNGSAQTGGLIYLRGYVSTWLMPLGSTQCHTKDPACDPECHAYLQGSDRKAGN